MDFSQSSTVQTILPTIFSSDTEVRHFVLADYVVFGGMLAVSTIIGIYFGIKDRFSDAGEFLTANGKLGVIPVALSMLASFLSSITLIGQPAEAFLFGSQLWLFGVSSIFITPIVGYIFAPFFQRKKYTSAYDYFGERFSRELQLIASFLFSVQMVLYLALVLYAPALAVHQVTGVNTLLIVSIMYLVCIFYTTVGGMKAVVWTDTFQVVVLYSALFTILIKGTIDIGGFSVVWRTNSQYNRTTLFDWNPDLTVRYTGWSALFGSAFLHVSFYGGNQLQIQRYLTVKTSSQARKMLWINAFGWIMVVLLTVYAGLLIFAYYATCDPIKSQKIKTADEIFPLYVMETLHEFPGFPGLFLAGVFSAGLSTVSTGINSLAAIWINEVRSSKLSNETWERRSGLWVKILSLFFGVFSFLLVFLVPYLGGLAPVAIALSGIFTGSLFGIFCLGMFFPFVNNLGAITGLIGSVVILTWMATGSIIFSRPPMESYARLNIPVTGCVGNFTTTATSFVTTEYDEQKESSNIYLYKVSFLWYPMLACMLTVTSGYLVSIVKNKISGLSFHVVDSKVSARKNIVRASVKQTMDDDILMEKKDHSEVLKPFLNRT